MEKKKMSYLKVSNKENEIILNTPNRAEILKDGPPKSSKYSILGRGAYGTVFKAIYRDKEVAVKIINSEKQIFRESIRSEENILNWDHRNIVKIFKIESTPKYGLVIMERYSGHCLQKVVDTIELPLAHRALITLDVLAALCYCHRGNLLHLDVKPENILISFKDTRNYCCKLCDFGASVKVENVSVKLNYMKGTIRYMSPEALSLERLTAAADIYSLGITMWQLQKRHLPYHWIECNEVVAYQVVKHNLRPDIDANDARCYTEQPLMNNRKNCVCENTDMNVSLHALEQIRNVLNRADIESTSVVRQNFDWISDPTQSNRGRCVKKLLLNSNANLVRDSNSPPVRMPSPYDTNIDTEKQQLIAYFTWPYPVDHNNNEDVYVELYKSCWHSDSKLRLNSTALQIRLEKILQNLFS